MKKKYEIESMLMNNKENILRRQRDKLNEKIEDKKYYEENMAQMYEMQELRNQKEREKAMSMKKYKEDLDRQVLENKKIKYGL